MTSRTAASGAPGSTGRASTGRASTGRARRRSPRGSGEQLRPEIVAAAKDLLGSAGDSGAVSIRAVADAVGVTPPSIYLHFADKDALMEAVVLDVFEQLDAAMTAGGAEAADPLSRLCAYGLAYVRFAVDHPEHYRLATMSRPEEDPGSVDQMLADSAFSRMVSTVTECMHVGVFAEADPVPVTMELWTAAHGVAALMISKPYLPWGDRQAFAEQVLRSVAMGHALNDLLGGDLSPHEGQAWFAEQRAARAAARGGRDA